MASLVMGVILIERMASDFLYFTINSLTSKGSISTDNTEVLLEITLVYIWFYIQFYLSKVLQSGKSCY